MLTPPKWRLLTNSWWFRTVSHPEMGWYREQFYLPKQKVVPACIEEWLDELALAVWLMDDGGVLRGETYTISTHSFDVRGCQRLVDALADRYGILSTLNYDGKGNRLYIRRQSAALVRRLTMPYVHPCMEYKLSLTP